MTRKQPDLQAIADEIAGRMAGESDRGAVADYIPDLAKGDLNRFGIAIAPIEGGPITAGDADEPFSIQSISKVFSLTLALERIGTTLWSRVGREPSGDPFNSIVQLEYERAVPRNPFINPGAIVVADTILEGRKPAEAIGDILALCRRLSGDDSVEIDESVAASEKRTVSATGRSPTSSRRRAISRGASRGCSTSIFHQCAVAMSCRQLATAGRYLCAAGQPVGGEDRTVSPERARPTPGAGLPSKTIRTVAPNVASYERAEIFSALAPGGPLG